MAVNVLSLSCVILQASGPGPLANREYWAIDGLIMGGWLKSAILCGVVLDAHEVANVFNTKGYTTFSVSAFSVDLSGGYKRNGGACFTFCEPENREFRS